jgi:hypothetical protein
MFWTARFTRFDKLNQQLNSEQINKVLRILNDRDSEIARGFQQDQKQF